MSAAEEPAILPDPRNPTSVSFSHLALELQEAGGTEETIDLIVEYSRSAVASDEAGVLLIHARRRLEPVASTSPDVTKAHQLQVDLGEGPCLDAAEEPTAISRIDDTLLEERWPRWSRTVADLGFRSVLAAPLATRTRRYGSINMYARRADAFDADDEAVAAILARHASVAVASSHNLEGLRNAVDARTVIGVAMGMLMAKYELENSTAFDVLRRFSQAQNIKLREVAERVVSERGLPPDW